MLWLVDIGNTHIVMGLYRSGKLWRHYRVASERGRTADEYAVLFKALLRDAGHGDLPHIEAVAIASVVPPLTQTLCCVFESYFATTPLIVGPQSDIGIRICCDDPSEVGADRIVNAVGGYAQYGGAAAEHGLLIIDFGTATTFDVVSPQGDYCGGAIAPGVAISLDALVDHAAKLPRVDLTFPESVVGTSTVTSMQAGVLYGYVSMVEGMMVRFRKALPYPLRVIATGGMAASMAAHTSGVDCVDPFLTLEGLRLVVERQRQQAVA